MPSWNPTILPVVITAEPLSTFVFPEPTVVTLLNIPGNIPPGPSTLTLGSITSFTGIIRMLSPGFAISKSTDFIFSSSINRSINSCLLT